MAGVSHPAATGTSAPSEPVSWLPRPARSDDAAQRRRQGGRFTSCTCASDGAPEQMTTYVELVRPGGVIVLEDPDVASWHFNPPAPALEELIALIVEAFRRTGRDWDAGRKHLDLFRSFGIEANVRAESVALPPG